MLSNIRARLTYANVMATIAVFLALGGTSYAVSQIDGKTIRNRSIPGVKLKKRAVTATELDLNHLVVPRARLADRAAHLFVTNAKANLRASRVAGDHRRAAPTSQGSLVKLSVGQAQPLFDAPPFQLSASCTDLGGGRYRVALAVTSSEPNWVGGGGPSDTHPAGQIVELLAVDDTQPYLTSGVIRATVAAPSGASLTLGTPSLGVHILGADCVANLYAVG